MQVNGKRAADDDDEEYDDVEVLICKRHSFPINFGASNRKYSEKLLHPYYPINDQNR